MAGITGVSAVVPTLFREGGGSPNLDVTAIARTIEHLVQGGVSALAVHGVASEPWALDSQQRAIITQTVVESTDGRVPVIVGIDASSREAAQDALLAANLGATHAMIRPSSVSKTPEALAIVLRDLATDVGLAPILQDVPQYSGVTLKATALVELAHRLPGLAGFKLEGPNSGPTVSALARLSVPVVVGWGGIHLPDRLARGAKGCMVGAGTARGFVRLYEEWHQNPSEAETTYRQYLPLLVFASESLDSGVPPVGRTRLLCGQGFGVVMVVVLPFDW